MGKRQSKPSIQAWISRESPEGGCVIINDTSSQTRLLEEILKQKRTVTAYEGYLVNEEDHMDDAITWDDSVSCVAGKCKSDHESLPIELVELPSEPDGKHIDIHFVKEGYGNDNTATQTSSPLKAADIDCGVSVRSVSSDRHQWSFSLYNFEDNGHISREDLTNLVRSIYDALGKSVEKASRKNPTGHVKKVKVHISVSKQKQNERELRVGTTVIPRREVVIGAEDTTENSDKQLEQQVDTSKKIRRRKERGEKCSTLQVLNNELGKVHLNSMTCKGCCPQVEQQNKYDFSKRCNGQAMRNSNVYQDHHASRRRTASGGGLLEAKLALLNQDLEQLVEKKGGRSQRRSARRRPTYPGHQSPPRVHSGYSSPDHVTSRTHHNGNSSPRGHVTECNSPIPHSPKRGVSLDPSYAYHADESKYLYVHAMPRQTPFEEPKSRKKRKNKTKKTRENQEIVDGGLTKYTTHSKAVVHRHEHVHHHYHHYEEKP